MRIIGRQALILFKGLWRCEDWDQLKRLKCIYLKQMKSDGLRCIGEFKLSIGDWAWKTGIPTIAASEIGMGLDICLVEIERYSTENTDDTPSLVVETLENCHPAGALRKIA